MSFQIETERLILRDVREDDIPILIPIFAERESRRNVLFRHWEAEYNKEVLENAMAWARFEGQREYYKLAVTLKADRTLIGTCSISGVSPESIKTQIGWHYGHQYRGKGYATEAARELLYIGFGLNDVREIYAECFVDNPASIAIMKKIGMRAFQDFSVLNYLRGLGYGEARSVVRYTISKAQWIR